MTKLTLEELEQIFADHNIEFNKTSDGHYDKNPLCAVIVYSQDNWPDKEYTLESRSYKTYSNTWGWDPSKLGHRRTGDSLDGSDVNVRLDWYNWNVEYC